MSARIVFDHGRVGAWIEAQSAGYYREGGKCIGLERDGGLVAGVLYDYDNGASVYTHIAVRGMLTRRFLWNIFHYPFVQLGAKVLIGLVPASNTKARAFDEHLGFKLVATIPEGHPDGSLLIYTMRRDECRFLGEEYVETESARSA